MAVIAKLSDVYAKLASQGINLESFGVNSATATGAAAASGGITFLPGYNSIGTTLWSTLQDIPKPAGLPSPTRLTNARFVGTRAVAFQLCYLYKFGTVALNATGDQFTHDAATFPVTRTNLRGSAQPLVLDPLITITTQTSTPAAIFTLKNAGATTGYKNQAGTTIVGTKTMTLPNVTTLVGSTYHFRLEDVANSGSVNDVGVQDIQSINVGTAAGAGAADVWGMEFICNLSNFSTTLSSGKDAVTRSFVLPDISPAVATSGTVVSKLVIMQIGNASSETPYFELNAFVDS